MIKSTGSPLSDCTYINCHPDPTGGTNTHFNHFSLTWIMLHVSWTWELPATNSCKSGTTRQINTEGIFSVKEKISWSSVSSHVWGETFFQCQKVLQCLRMDTVQSHGRGGPELDMVQCPNWLFQWRVTAKVIGSTVREIQFDWWKWPPAEDRGCSCSSHSLLSILSRRTRTYTDMNGTSTPTAKHVTAPYVAPRCVAVGTHYHIE